MAEAYERMEPPGLAELPVDKHSYDRDERHCHGLLSSGLERKCRMSRCLAMTR
jgi:hypothetical protein